MPRKSHCCCRSSIRCVDGTFQTCFEGKCVQVVGSAWSDGICNCCADVPISQTTGPLNYHVYPGFSGFVGGCFSAASNCGGIAGDDCCDLEIFPHTLGYGVAVAIFGPDDHDFSYIIVERMVWNAAGESTRIQYRLDGPDAADAMDRLCSGEAVAIPYWRKRSGGSGFSLSGCPDGGADDEWLICVGTGSGVSIQLVECESPPPTPSFNCVDSACIDPGDGTGTYATLDDCVSSGCAPPPDTYNCVDATCVDPLDGTGTYPTLLACTSDGCTAPTCDLLIACDPPDGMTLPLRVAGFTNCTDVTSFYVGGPHDGDPDGVEYFPLTNFNGLFELAYLSAAFLEIRFFLDLGTEADFGDPGIIRKQRTIASTTYFEYTYCYRIEVAVVCDSDTLKVHIIEVNYFLQTWHWNDPESPGAHYDGLSGVEYRPPDSYIEASIIPCGTGPMRSVFGFNDCNGSPVTFSATGSVLP